MHVIKRFDFVQAKIALQLAACMMNLRVRHLWHYGQRRLIPTQRAGRLKLDTTYGRIGGSIYRGGARSYS